MKFIQIKANKDSYYAADDWLKKYDYEAEYIRTLNNNPNLQNPKCPDPLFRRLNWNQMNYETLSMMKMYVEFYDEKLEILFLMTMSDHVEKIHNPFDEIDAKQKIEEAIE
jgi:hypothetical protein